MCLYQSVVLYKILKFRYSSFKIYKKTQVLNFTSAYFIVIELEV